MARRLLLINPAHMVAGRRRRGFAQFPVPPLGLGYVAALTPPGWTIRLIDENLCTEDGAEWAPDLVGITSLTQNAPRAYALASAYRSRGVPVVLGGVHASILPDEAATYADSVVVGDAEAVWGRLIADFERGQLGGRYQGDFLPLDGLVAPRRDLYPQRYFTETIITSKGCPNTCDFCSVWRFYERTYRTRPVDEVVDELESLPGRGIVLIADDNMAVNRRRTIALCQRIVERGVQRRYAIQATLGIADDADLLQWLRRSGCLYVIIGLESLNEDTLAHIGKPDLLRAGVGGYRECIARIHAHGMAFFGSFIVGFEQDSSATFRRIRTFILGAGVDCALIHILHPLPGTLLWDRMRQDGRLLYTDFPADYVLYDYDNVSFQPNCMTPAELQEGTRWLTTSLTRLPVVLRRARGTLRATGSPLAALSALVWNWRSSREVRGFPARDVRARAAPTAL